ncbi:MAG: dephospho-CoA kinase [Pseudomonadota bacterium]
MRIIGLTGSIAMGKSTAARLYRYCGVPVHDSDATVHRLLGHGGRAVAQVDAMFPGVVEGCAVNRAKLGHHVFGAPEELKKLEQILHPMVREEEAQFLHAMARRRASLVVLDIPLLFETGGDRRCDIVCVVSCPLAIQRQRVMRRPGMTEERFQAILSRQTPDREKRVRADFVLQSSLGLHLTLRQVMASIRLSREYSARKWRPGR